MKMGRYEVGDRLLTSLDIQKPITPFQEYEIVEMKSSFDAYVIDDRGDKILWPFTYHSTVHVKKEEKTFRPGDIIVVDDMRSSVFSRSVKEGKLYVIMGLKASYSHDRIYPYIKEGNTDELFYYKENDNQGIRRAAFDNKMVMEG